MSREQLSKVMKRAHHLAKQMTGNYKARLSIALRQAWNELKIKNVEKGEMSKMATVKQIEYADVIKKEIVSVLDQVEEAAQKLEDNGRGKNSKGESRIMKGYHSLYQQVSDLDTETHAASIIKYFQHILNDRYLDDKLFNIKSNLKSSGLFQSTLVIAVFLNNVINHADIS